MPIATVRRRAVFSLLTAILLERARSLCPRWRPVSGDPFAAIRSGARFYSVFDRRTGRPPPGTARLKRAAAMGSSVVFVLLHSRGCEEGTTVLNDGSAPESLLGGY
jgi:hypothetical protein